MWVFMLSPEIWFFNIKNWKYKVHCGVWKTLFVSLHPAYMYCNGIACPSCTCNAVMHMSSSVNVWWNAILKHNHLWHSPWPPWGPSAPFGPGGPGSPWGPCSPGGPLIPGIMKKSLLLSPLLEGRCFRGNMRGWQQFSKRQWGQQGNWVTAYHQVSVHKTLTNQCTYIHTFIDHFPKGAFQCQLQRKR